MACGKIWNHIWLHKSLPKAKTKPWIGGCLHTCTIMYYHGLSCAPFCSGKEDTCLFCKASNWKKIIGTKLFSCAASKTLASVGQIACRPPESTNSHIIWFFPDDTRICSAKRFKPDFCKDCKLATPQKQRGHYAPRYFVLGGMLLLCHTVPLIIFICLIRNKYFENL